MNYKNREQYKHLMRVLAVAAIVLLECAVFSVFWDRYYASHLWLEPFWDKGNQIIVVIYGIFLLVFMYIYGGMKIGYMKGSSIIYSQMMTAFCANALMYLQIILLWRHLPYILPMVGMTLVDFALAGIVSWLFEKTFARLFPPREVLLIYGEYPMESLELKMNQRPEMAEASERKRQSILRVEREWIMRGCKARTTKSKERIQRYEALLNQEAPETDEAVQMVMERMEALKDGKGD